MSKILLKEVKFLSTGNLNSRNRWKYFHISWKVFSKEDNEEGTISRKRKWSETETATLNSHCHPNSLHGTVQFSYDYLWRSSSIIDLSKQKFRLVFFKTYQICPEIYLAINFNVDSTILRSELLQFKDWF